MYHKNQRNESKYAIHGSFGYYYFISAQTMSSPCSLSGFPKRSITCQDSCWKFLSWWLNQPIRKICVSSSIISAVIGVKMKNIWNHHLVSVDIGLLKPEGSFYYPPWNSNLGSWLPSQFRALRSPDYPLPGEAPYSLKQFVFLFVMSPRRTSPPSSPSTLIRTRTSKCGSCPKTRETKMALNVPM